MGSGPDESAGDLSELAERSRDSARRTISTSPTRMTSPGESRCCRTVVPLNCTPSGATAATSKFFRFQLMRQWTGATPSASTRMSLDASRPTSSGTSFESSRVSIIPVRWRISRAGMRSLQIGLMRHREFVAPLNAIHGKESAADVIGAAVAISEFQPRQPVFRFFRVEVKDDALADFDARLSKELQVGLLAPPPAPGHIQPLFVAAA